MPHDHAIQTCASSVPDTGGCCGAVPPPADASIDKGRSFRVAGLDCAEEVAILNKALGPALGGEAHLAFDILNARMTVLETAQPVRDEEVLRLVAQTGMRAKPWDAKTAEADHRAQIKRQKNVTMLAAAFWGAGLAYHGVEAGAAGFAHVFAGHGDIPMPMPEVVAFLLATLCGVWQIAPKALFALKRLSPDMNLLMMVAIAGAIALGEYFEAATVAFLFTLSLTLESWSVGRARDAVSALLDLAPTTARVIQKDGTDIEVLAAEVQIGDRFVVRAGDRIPLDGEVIDGSGAVDQAPITGESALVPKEAGDGVFAGTINGDGTLTVRATARATDTVLAKITTMVNEAHARRADVEQWVTRFARIYTPVVMGLAAILAVLPPLLMDGDWAGWFYNALVLLVIACPCALVISTPVSIVAALAAAARNGVLVKGGAYIELPSRLAALAMDKTGTLTEGKPHVAEVFPSQASARKVVATAAALEAHSSHPLALAILAHPDAKSVLAAQNTQSVPGMGIEGSVSGEQVWLGSARMAARKNCVLPEAQLAQIEEAGSTLVAVGTGETLLGLLEVRDRIRPEAHAVISALHKQGLSKIVMLTGDNPKTASVVAKEVGIDETRAGLLPQDKVDAIEALSETYPVVAMIGDGVNDAPAMARADFAIAMGAIGSDAAIETADIALMSDDIAKLPWLINHSRRTMSVIRQNIVFALVTKAIFVGLTALGLASMWGAIAADVGVSLAVVANALRLLKA
ncbi:heavy metal translocating P-type ATPase [Shimia thalassica]|uniref:heavy metal translocating P-type ATPase n=1 Tax=Shimia thalassica TaxID=1715693 RepID=UPI0026E34895|nr:cation-translocating P-type ATPase [Shimia thalassica]MDO6797152.1 cation-translocating P-type ATPase [Shimia thalassica]